VNEASCIIQEAAHEDANIIFGAVVDPAITGKVKITVIATGFDRKHSSRAVPAAAMKTPVDLTNYGAHQTRVPDAPAPAREAQPVAAQQQGLHVSRRPPIDLTLPTTATGPLTGAGTGAVSGVKSHEDLGDLELQSPLDVPAFLRRQS